jgi:metal-responsive CopG/Arc/MetJ family transcriptional regulator
MLKRTSIWLEQKNLHALESLGKKKGGLKPAQLIRVAIQEYLEREQK